MKCERIDFLSYEFRDDLLKFLQGLATVADPVFLIERELGHRFLKPGENEERVITEPLLSNLLEPDLPAAFPLDNLFSSPGRDDGNGTSELCVSPGGRNVLHQGQELPVIFPVRCLFPRKPGRVDSRASIQGIDNQSGVI